MSKEDGQDVTEEQFRRSSEMAQYQLLMDSSRQLAAAWGYLPPGKEKDLLLALAVKIRKNADYFWGLIPEDDRDEIVKGIALLDSITADPPLLNAQLEHVFMFEQRYNQIFRKRWFEHHLFEAGFESMHDFTKAPGAPAASIIKAWIKTGSIQEAVAIRLIRRLNKSLKEQGKDLLDIHELPTTDRHRRGMEKTPEPEV